MNGEIAAANQRLASSDFRDDSARQGATIAFRSATSSPTLKPQPSAAAAAALASTANRHAALHRQKMESDGGPEVGSVKDKIGRFTTTSLAPPVSAGARGRPSQPCLSPAPEQIAARLAASRSPQRNPEPAMAAAKIGAVRSASKMPSRPTEDRQLRAPTPIRSTHTGQGPLDNLLQDDRVSFARDPGYGRSPSLPPRAASVRERAPSPSFSIASRASTSALSAPPEQLKPKLPPRNTGSSVSTARKAVSGGPLLRSATPSMASISGKSFNSSSSVADEPTGMNEEALSNAIVASSLASSRASPSPATKIPPTPPRRRRARSILQIAQSPKGDLSRTPSPPKGMPQTLRGMPKSDDAEAHRRHKMHLLHKHPHKHHEGDRKRWRREVTEKERKRYEGVWASNKGLHISAGRDDGSDGTEKWPPPTEMVLNLVVREIWSRSRLPTAVLEQVWDLVDHQQIGLLTKEEFVVGMWLIDQQLKGHKLPNTIPDSVWDSVRYVTGIRLSSTPRTQG